MRDIVHMLSQQAASKAVCDPVDLVIALLEKPRVTLESLVESAANDYRDEEPEEIEAMDPERYKQIVWAYFDKSDETGEAIHGYEKRLNDLCRDDTAAAGALLAKLRADYVRPFFAELLATERQERAQDRADDRADSYFENYKEI